MTEILTAKQTADSFRKLGQSVDLYPSWHPDIPVSDEVEQAMRQLSEEIESEAEAEAMLPWFLIEQAY